MSAAPNTAAVRAPAKVNLFLRILGSRDDGYHDLESLVAPLSLADRLVIHAVSDPSQFRTLTMSLELNGDPRITAGVPVDESNLVLRAASALAETTGARGFADITLTKKVPVAAGLGGGSSDAAATLVALNDLWGCALPEVALREIGARVGSDVPALMLGGAALARGRGEIVEPVDARSFRWAVVTFPFEVRTAEAFGWWDADGGHPKEGDPQAVIQAARTGDPEALGRALFNDLEGPVQRRHPEVAREKERLIAAGAAGAVMCGSGPTVAALLPEGVRIEDPAVIEATSG